jgi:hypothetical protein
VSAYDPTYPPSHACQPPLEPLDLSVRWPERPAEQFLCVTVGVGLTRSPVVLDLRRHGPHVVCTGGDRSDFLRTVLVGLANWFSPALVQFVVADSDHRLASMQRVPHTGTHASGLATEPKLAARLARAIDWEVWRRASLAEHELARQPALVLAFEDVDRLIVEWPELRPALDAVARDGARLRMHLLMSATDPTGLPGLPVSVVDGRGKLGSQRFRLTACTPEQLEQFSSEFAYRYYPVRSLWYAPPVVPYERMTAHDTGGEGVPIGVLDDGSLTTLRHDFSRTPHVVVRAPRGWGKTTTLRTVLRGLAATDAVVLDLNQVTPVVGRIRTLLMRRLADPESWDGPELFIVVDDYDTVPATADPLAPLADLLRHGSSIGVHLVAAGTELGRRAVLDALTDRAVIMPVPADLPGPRYAEPLPPPPRGRANYDGRDFQIAIDTAPHPLEFRPVDDLFAAGAPVAQENVSALVGMMDGGVPVTLDLREHVWCGGDAGMGKTTLLRRIAFSLADLYSPAVVHLVVAGDRLGDVAALPLTAAYVPNDPTRLTTLLDDELRRRLTLEREGRPAGVPHLVVLVDGVANAAADTLRRVAAVGARVHMTLVVAERSAALPDLHRMMSVRVTLPYHGEGAEARTLGVPKITSRRHAGPGAAYVRVGDDRPRSFLVTDVTRDHVREARFQPRAPAVRALPLTPPRGVLTDDELALLAPDGVPVGLDGDGQPVYLDLDRHLVVAGPPGSGRSTVLRSLLRGIVRRYPASDCAVLLLHDDATARVLPAEHVLATSSGFEPTMMDEVLTALRKRVGDPEWTGPRLVVAVDDLDLFAPEHDPLTALAEVLPHATEIGLHVLATGGPAMNRPELAATRLSLPVGGTTGSAVAEIPERPEVGHGILGNRQVLLPWCQV